MWTRLADLLYPPRCGGCGGPGALFCASCQGSLVLLAPPLCPRCGGPVTRSGLPAGGSSCCARCLLSPPAFEAARSVAAYEGRIRAAIHILKYRGRRALGEHLGRLLAAQAPPEVTHRVAGVVPVPLHPSRLVSRGFNHAELLARPLAAQLRVPCLSDALRRVQETPQAELSAVARRQNVLRAFAPGPTRVWGTVLLVDDVFSTGSTAAACARALLEAGASRVVVLTLARALLRLPRRGARPEPGFHLHQAKTMREL